MNHPPDRKRKTRLVARFLLGVVFLGALVWISAGRLDWYAGWAVILFFLVSTLVVLLFADPDLLEERTNIKKDVVGWDRILAPLVGHLSLSVPLVVAGLDLRFGWSRGFDLPWRLAAVPMLIAGYGISFWALKTNRFFSAVVRIQRDRDHVVVDGGPYRLVRHPGYAGIIVFALALPVFLGSVFAYLPVIALAVVIVVRTSLEDSYLQRELAGYGDYTRRVRYRLIPGVW